MKLNALVMTRSYGSVRVLVAAFAELGIEYRISPSASETIEMLAGDYHSALIVDFELPHAIQVAKVARATSARSKPVLFGMIGSQTSIASVFQAGANFVLYKPLDPLQVLHSLRAAQAFMREDRRRSSRQKSESLAYLQLQTGTVPALVQDITDQGISLQAAEPMLPMRHVQLRFLLPGTTNVVHARADFIWTDEQGRAGLFFTEMAAGCRRDLQAWLKKRGARKSESVRSLLESQTNRALVAAH